MHGLPDTPNTIIFGDLFYDSTNSSKYLTLHVTITDEVLVFGRKLSWLTGNHNQEDHTVNTKTLS